MSKYFKTAVLVASVLALTASVGVVRADNEGTSINPQNTLPIKAQRQSAISGKLTAINGNSLTVTNSKGVAYAVDAAAAKLLRRFGAAMVIADFQVNDELQVRGMVNGTAVSAITIRDLSLQRRNGTFSGSVKSVSSTSFILTSKKRGDQTINTDSSTVFKKGSVTGRFADLQVGLNITVAGVWDRTNVNVTATRITIPVRSIRINGAVSAISASTLTVTDKNATAYSVDASSASVTRKKTGTIAVGDVVIGDSVRVYGTHLDGSMNVKAKLVQDLTVK